MPKWYVIFFCLLAGNALAGGADEASRVVLVANRADPDSQRIAEHYALRRGVPVANIISLDMPMQETITWREFVLSIWQPLQDELVDREWIDGIAMSLHDDYGRRKIAFSGHRISYLVLCRGVPLRIKHEPTLMSEVKGLTDRAQFRTNRSSVDSELSLLAAGNYNINAFIPNPLFRKESPAELILENVVRVSRLDGPTAKDVFGMIDGALQAEREGLVGRAYVDSQGPYPRGERWLKRTAKVFRDLNFPLTERDETGTFPQNARFDAPALYAGWYTTNADGPFTLPGFRFAPGAVAMHIHSYSAHTLRSDSKSWCGPLLARGAVATCGAVYEPYLELMHHPDLLFKGLAEGMTLGEAGYYAVSVLSWQNVLIGDPLYRPFQRSQTEQWMRRDEVSPQLTPYVILREMQRLQSAGLIDDAVALANREQKARPSLPVGVALAEILTEKGDVAGAARAVGFARYLKRVEVNSWGLLSATVPYLTAGGKGKSAVEVYRNLLALKLAPKELRIQWLAEAIKVAHGIGDMRQGMDWEREKTQLAAEPIK